LNDEDVSGGLTDLQRRNSVLNLLRRKSLLTKTEVPLSSFLSPSLPLPLPLPIISFPPQTDHKEPTQEPQKGEESHRKGSAGGGTEIRGGSTRLKKKRSLWQAQALNFLESFRALSLILILISFLLVHFLLCALLPWPAKVLLLDQIDFGISLVLVLEILVRLYCFGVVNKGISSFFSSKFHLLDLSVMSLDVFLIALNSQLIQNHDQPFPTTLL
jgi:hypothetical protein